MLAPALGNSCRCEREKTAARFSEKGKAFLQERTALPKKKESRLSLKGCSFLLSTNKIVQSASKIVQSKNSEIAKLGILQSNKSLFLAWQGMRAELAANENDNENENFHPGNASLGCASV